MNSLIIIFSIFFSINASAGGFSWTCDGTESAARWNGKPLRPIGNKIELLIKRQNIKTLVIMEENQDPKVTMIFKGILDEQKIIVKLISSDILFAKMTVLINETLLDKDIDCSPY